MNNASYRGSNTKSNERGRLEAIVWKWMHRLSYYGLALLFVAAAAVLRWALSGVLGPTPFLAFYLAWVGAAAFGGLGPGLLATVASWVCLEWLFDFTPGQTIFNSPEDLGRFVVLMAGGLTVSLVAERMRRGRIREQRQMQRLAEQTEELQTANEELRTSEQRLTLALAERQRAEEALQERNKFLNLVLESLTHPFYVVDAANYDILIANTATGVKGPLSKAKCYFAAHGRSVPCPDKDADHPCPLVEVRRTGKPTVVEHVHYDASGNPRNVEVHAYPLLDAQGSVAQIIEYCLDITERKRAEKALQESNERLQAQTEELQTQTEELQANEAALRDLNATLESKVAQRTAELQQRARQLQKLTLELSQVEDRERKRMAEILHDDLQQIIAGAKFHLGLLRNRAKYDASVQAIAAQIDQMLKDAIEKSRGLSHELSPAVLHHGDLKETLGWLAGQVQAKHGLIVHVHAHGQPRLQSDAVRNFLFRAAQELLFNVVKHARVKEARVRVRQWGQCVCVSVSDRGRGFNPQELRETAGFGLLSIQERIELLGGRMKIKSVKGKGSTFFIVVSDGPKSEDAVGAGRDPKRDESRLGSPPRAYPTSVTQDGDGGKEGGHGGPPLRVLLADDHRIVREGLRSLLSEEHDVEIVGEAMHGREAVDLALRLEPDVVIMDVSMPLIDGDEATRQIKEHLPRIRVIALSTSNEPAKIQKMFSAGAEAYVLKTTSPEELLTAIRGESTAGA